MMTNREKLLIGILIILGIILSGSIYINSQKPSQFIYKDEKPKLVEKEIEGIEVDSTPVEPEPIGVHIGGQVKYPGFIWIEEGTRLYDALEQVGGPLEDANLDAINLSKKLTDEEKIHIPKIGEETEIIMTSSNTSPGGKVNINRATEAELTTLPGIGPVLANKIVDYREASGPFKTIEDIKNVTGIGDKRFKDIEDLITTR